MVKYKLIINLKTYKESTNKNAIKIAKICYGLRNVAKKYNVEIILAPQLIDLKEVVAEKVKVYAQSIDFYDYGAHTGFVVPEILKELKVLGSIINHSEHRFEFSEIKKRIDKAKEVGLETCICARDIKDLKELVKLNPDFIAVEPKELIGGNISISSAKPKLILDSVKAVKNIPLLVGAGVKNKEDVRKSIELGAKGILVASGVIKVKNIKGAILDLLEGFNF